MPTPFDDISLRSARSLIKKPDGYDERYEALVSGNWWNKGGGFVGPRKSEPVTGSGSGERGQSFGAIYREGLKRSFTPLGLASEVQQRRTSSVCAKRPRISVGVRRELGEDEKTGEKKEPTPDEQTRISEMRRRLEAWFEERGLQRTIKDVADGVSAFERMYLRPLVPAGRLKEGEDRDGRPVFAVPGESPSEALENIFAEAMYPSEAVRYTDRHQMAEIGVAHFAPARDELRDRRTQESAEVSYLSGDKRGRGTDENSEGWPLTVLGIVEKDGRTQEAEMDLRGHLLLHEASERRAFISPAMWQQQRAADTASTEMRVVNDEEGFPMRVFANAVQPHQVTTVKDESGDTRQVPVPVPFKKKPGGFAFMQGEPIEDPEAPPNAEGQAAVVDLKNVGVHTLEAGDPGNYQKEIDARRRAILRMAKQLFVEITGDATASGESRIQALFDFLLDAQTFKEVIEGALANLLETTWYMACHLAGEAGRDHDLKVSVECQITMPFLPAALLETGIKLVEKGIWSREHLQRLSGVDDLKGEEREIRASKDYELEMKSLVSEILKTLSQAGAGLRQAAEFAGVEEEKATRLARTDFVTNGER